MDLKLPDSDVRQMIATNVEPAFAFGRNWQRYASGISEGDVDAAALSLRSMLGTEGIVGQSFLDIGSGSGIFSLAAIRLGARHVHSFDSDPDSVGCTASIKQRYAPESGWTVERGNILDDAYISHLGLFDIVYAWGVLHHTGDLWGATDRATRLVRPGGTLFIAIYNDQGVQSRLWRTIKQAYCRLPAARPVIASGSAVYFGVRGALGDLARGQSPLARYHGPSGRRGMKFWPDLIDWVGGFPFEVARPSAVSAYCQARGFALRRLVTTRGVGNNQFVFDRSPMAMSMP